MEMAWFQRAAAKQDVRNGCLYCSLKDSGSGAVDLDYRPKPREKDVLPLSTGGEKCRLRFERENHDPCPAIDGGKPSKVARAAVDMEPSCVTSAPVCACVATTVGMEAKPIRVNSAVLVATAANCLSAAGPAAMPAIPPFFSCMEVSCAFIAATGSLAASKAAPCVRLLSLSSPTGIHTNRARDVNGRAAFHNSVQWGHWGSKNTYTVCAAIDDPTENPTPSAATALTVTAVEEEALPADVTREVASGALLQAERSSKAADAATAGIKAPRIKKIGRNSIAGAFKKNRA